CGSVSETPIGVAHAAARKRTPISAASAETLLDRIPAPRQACRVGLLVIAVGGLLLSLRLLIGGGSVAVRTVVSHHGRSAADGPAAGRALARVTGDGAADGADRGSARRASHRPVLWRRRRGGLWRRGGIEPCLLRGPVVALVLILLERILALS